MMMKQTKIEKVKTEVTSTLHCAKFSTKGTSDIKEYLEKTKYSNNLCIRNHITLLSMP